MGDWKHEPFSIANTGQYAKSSMTKLSSIFRELLEVDLVNGLRGGGGGGGISFGPVVISK